MFAAELTAFINNWEQDKNNIKPLFTSLLGYAKDLPGVTMSYKGRPGVSHSVRLSGGKHKERPFFAILDIIDDEPDSRWLSACFYADLVSDPEERGDIVPGGLEGDKDALCFDVDEPGDFAEYIAARISEGAV